MEARLMTENIDLWLSPANALHLQQSSHLQHAFRTRRLGAYYTSKNKSDSTRRSRARKRWKPSKVKQEPTAGWWLGSLLSSRRIDAKVEQLNHPGREGAYTWR